MANVLAIVPARGGSKGIPRKNMTECNGKPLLWWTLNAIAESQLITVAGVSSDSARILDYAAMFPDYRVKAWLRPKELAEDTTPTVDVLAYHLGGMQDNYDAIVLLQPTSPVRTGQQIDEAIGVLSKGYDSVFSGVPTHSFRWWPLGDSYGADYHWQERPRRQDMALQYEENGSIYVCTVDNWKKERNWLGGKIGLYEMPEWCRFQVDTLFDLWLCQEILRGYSSSS